MKNDLERTVRLLEDATAAGDAPADQLDPETASLREAWLAFGEMLEAAQPTMGLPENSCLRETPLHCNGGALRRSTPSHARPRRQRLLATGLLAASLLIGVATVWMLRSANRQDNPMPTTEPQASTHRHVAPSTQTHAKSESAADEPQWDDSLDEQFEQVSWQMTCVRQNQFFRTDAFGIVQYQVEQFRQAIQTDSL